jgi:hypothetical protein
MGPVEMAAVCADAVAAAQHISQANSPDLMRPYRRLCISFLFRLRQATATPINAARTHPDRHR